MPNSARAAIVVLALALSPGTVAAQVLKGRVVATGLNLPLAFVQDPSNPSVQYIVEQVGTIRVLRAGALQTTPFLDLTGVTSASGEQGLLGLAFAPDYATSGRLFVNYTNLSGNTVVARYRRATVTPDITADPASHFELLWSTGERIIRQPFANHNGGTIIFGPDGYLYIGMGDGGSGNDPMNNAQNMNSLLGKMLRIDVSVPDSNVKGFAIPPTNPFLMGSAPEIWDVGLRNPFKYSFDDPAHGGTGALVIGDVGQDNWEEVDYEPPATGAVNYGWRIREGANNNITTLPPAYLPLTDPIYQYSHAVGHCIIGGYVYRGSALGSGMNGRYFFADYVNNRVWSMALTVNPSTGLATPSDLREHTSELLPNNVTSFGVDAAGELYLVNYGDGTIVKVVRASFPLLTIDGPRSGSALTEPFTLFGWAIDALSTSTAGIDAVHVWAYPGAGGSPSFAGAAQLGGSRPDVAQAFGGAQFALSGFSVTVRGLAPGDYMLVVYGLVHTTGTFDVVSTVNVHIASSVLLSVDAPVAGSMVNRPILAGGWAFDAAALTGTGIDAVHIWGINLAQPATYVFLSAVTVFSNRPDVASVFGAQYIRSGYTALLNPPSAGVWEILIYAHNAISGQFTPAPPVIVTVR